MLHKFRNVVSNVITNIGTHPNELTNDEDAILIAKNSPATQSAMAARKNAQPYSRPEFLHMDSAAIDKALNHVTRPVIIQPPGCSLPWNAGYAETVNAGKSDFNEDQCKVGIFNLSKYLDGSSSLSKNNPHLFHYRSTHSLPGSLHSSPSGTPRHSFGKGKNRTAESCDEGESDDIIAFGYFALFDGHAGTGTALMAASHLHDRVRKPTRDASVFLNTQERLSEVRSILISLAETLPPSGARPHSFNPASGGGGGLANSAKWTALGFPPDMSVDSVVTGALESSFRDMDQHIGEEHRQGQVFGGCTVLVALFFLGKLYVANSGDSRAVICHNGKVIPCSRDFTPESERQRLKALAHEHPELLGGEFCHIEFPTRLKRTDLGKRVLYRDAYMQGWAYKTVMEEDLKFPLVYGEGKKARMLATIGVTRGFGDFDLKVQGSDIHIKPFLSNVPEVTVCDISKHDHSENDVLIMATDGMWDVLTNSEVAAIVDRTLSQFDVRDARRYVTAAQELVLRARGVLGPRGWRGGDDDRPASGDDISVLCIPLRPYAKQKATLGSIFGPINDLAHARPSILSDRLRCNSRGEREKSVTFQRREASQHESYATRGEFVDMRGGGGRLSEEDERPASALDIRPKLNSLVKQSPSASKLTKSSKPPKSGGGGVHSSDSNSHLAANGGKSISSQISAGGSSTSLLNPGKTGLDPGTSEQLPRPSSARGVAAHGKFGALRNDKRMSNGKLGASPLTNS